MSEKKSRLETTIRIIVPWDLYAAAALGEAIKEAHRKDFGPAAMAHYAAQVADALLAEREKRGVEPMEG